MMEVVKRAPKSKVVSGDVLEVIECIEGSSPLIIPSTITLLEQNDKREHFPLSFLSV